jgi:hypothetical protein
MSNLKDRRERQLAVVGAIGREHFQTGVRMLYACRYGDALRKLGIRKPPVLAILPRSHPVNVLLGKALRRKVKQRPLPA